MFPTQAPPPSAWRSATALADWIEQLIPCYDDSHPIPWPTISQILKTLDFARIPKDTVVEALDELAGRGIRFIRPISYYEPRLRPSMSNLGTVQTNMTGPTFASAKQSIQDTLAHHDERLQAAMLSGDPAGAEQVLEAILDLFWAWLKSESNARKNRLPEKTLRWEEINRAVDEAFERARFSRTHIRRISRAEWEELRRAPTPRSARSIRIRLSRGVVRRNAARREARRRTRR